MAAAPAERRVAQVRTFRSAAEGQQFLASLSAREFRVRGKPGETPLPAGLIRFKSAAGVFMDVTWRAPDGRTLIEVLDKCVCG